MNKAPLHSEFSAKKTVTHKDLASVYGSGKADVFSTPAMISFMEGTCNDWFSQYLDEGYISVGAAIHIRHLRPTPEGMEVTCIAKYVGMEDNLHKFETRVYDETQLIGDGYQLRGVVHKQKFEHTTKEKLEHNDY